jgi:hypothetical protein
MAIDYIIERSRDLKAKTHKRLLLYLGIVPGLLFLGALLFSAAGESMLSIYSSIFYTAADTTHVGQGLTKWSLGLRNLAAVQSGLWIVFFLVAAVSVIIWMYLTKKVKAVILLLIPLLIMVDGIRFNKKFVRTYDYRQQFTSNVLTDYVRDLPGKFRVLNLRSLPADYLPFFGIEVVTGYHGNQLRWYDDLLGGPGTRNLGNPNFINLANARYILAPGNTNLPQDYLGVQPLTVQQEFGQMVLYRNDNALPRAYLIDNYEVIQDRKEIYPRILDPRTDIRGQVFLEEEPSIKIEVVDSLIREIVIADYAIDSVLLNVETDHNTLLVLGDNYYKHWEAFVDGEKKEILRANGSFRAIPIETGSRQVLFKYNHDGNKPAAIATQLTLLLVAIILLIYLLMYIKERKKVALEA